MLTIFVGLFGCSEKVSHTPVNIDIEDFQEIDCEELSIYLHVISEEIPSSEAGHQVNYMGIDDIYLWSEDMRIHYVYYDYVYELDESEVSYINEDGIDTRDIEQAYSDFTRRWNDFEEFCEDNPDDIIMEMQDTRGYIIFDIDDPEIISEISFREDVNENARYYGCVYFCDRGCLDAYFLSDNDEYFEKFVEILDEFGLPYM